MPITMSNEQNKKKTLRFFGYKKKLCECNQKIIENQDISMDINMNAK